MKILFLLSVLVCFLASYLYFTKVLTYAVAMPIIVSCFAIMLLDKTIKAYKLKNKRAFGIFGISTVLAFTFVITSVLGII